ncbi:hypothetical protein ACMHYB_45320 [Sorangium sp. So ce1128]
MSRFFTCGRPIVIGIGVGAISLMTHVPRADARTANKAIALNDLTLSSPEALPIDILRRVAQDYASRGTPVSCRNLRRCDDLDLHGSSVDLDGDGSKEWFVTDKGFTGTGAELDYIFQKGADRRWKMIGRIEGLHLRMVGPKKTRGFFDIRGYVAGRCVEGRGKAIWNGHQYVKREGRVKDRPC